MNYSREKEVAIEAVSRAAALCAQVRAEMVGAQSLQKEDKSPVTIADFGSQSLVCRSLKAAFPDDAIVAEEDSADLQKPENAGRLDQIVEYVQRFEAGSTARAVCEWIDTGQGSLAERYWTLDPIDGTKGFLRNDQYAIALALVENGDVKVAALACPALPLNSGAGGDSSGALFVAVRGAGAFMAPLGSGDFVPIRVAQDVNSAASRFAESVEAGHGDQSLQEAIARAAGITQPSLRMDSQAKYGAVARGDAVLYLRLPSPKSPNYREKIWDHAAGTLVVEEAGGRVTDMNGRALDFARDRQMNHNRGVVVSNGPMHAAVLEALAQASS